jgi:hypothetical protein
MATTTGRPAGVKAAAFQVEIPMLILPMEELTGFPFRPQLVAPSRQVPRLQRLRPVPDSQTSSPRPRASSGWRRPSFSAGRRAARRGLRQTSSAMAGSGGGLSGPPCPRGRSPSSVFLALTRNLSREQGVPLRHSIWARQMPRRSTTCTGFGWVSVNYPG